MGVHSVGVTHRENSGFGNIGKDAGWVFKADEYILDNRYYSMFDHDWELELVHNKNGVPSRYQWYYEGHKGERPIMTHSDMALVLDLKNHMFKDRDGNEGAIDCAYKSDYDSSTSSDGYPGAYRGYDSTSSSSTSADRYHTRGRSLKAACPVASDAIKKMLEYKKDNKAWLYDFEKVLEKMLKNGYAKKYKGNDWNSDSSHTSKKSWDSSSSKSGKSDEKWGGWGSSGKSSKSKSSSSGDWGWGGGRSGY